jgi:2-deoxy-D-gluconate 3-dehydrogenase
MNPPFSLTGRRALVTGSGRGLGRAIATALAEAGADVACADRTLAGSNDTAAAVRAAGRTAWQLEADLADRDALTAMAHTAIEQAGQIDILVNCGGTIARQAATEHSLDDWDRVLRTNLDATWILSQFFGRDMIARGNGKIINIASLLSFSGGITVPGYTASKHAVAGITRALANEWAGRGVNVNAIAPGYFRTDNTRALQDDPARSRDITARIPAGRWGEPHDITGPAVFLASPASDYIHGHILVVDGGWMAR